MPVDPRKIALFRKRLLDFLERAGREHLPWRQPGLGAYEIWVSEVMLQQTQVTRVVTYYTRFLKRFPTVERLAEASWEEFLSYYAGLGYYSRGRNMLKAAHMVVAEFGGKFPTDVAALQRLPGVGPYTARAIASFAGDAPHLAWDTNLTRVFGRVFKGGKGLLTREEEAFFDARLGRDAQRLNAALMDFGAMICVARPKCEACLLRDMCRYYREGGRREQKTTRKKTRGFSKNAERAIVYLHENHRRYFSAEKKKFAPFVLPAGYADRAAIKEYFKQKYALDLAVRPPHARAMVHGQEAVLVNAQILLGKPTFAVFPAEARRAYDKMKPWKSGT